MALTWLLLAIGGTLLAPVAVLVAQSVVARRHYRRSAYFAATGREWADVTGDPGRRGEYMLSRRLESMGLDGQHLLFNMYVPRRDGTTSEVDVCMIGPAGVFVFEMKNYSGWIFGSRTDSHWTQVFPNKRKERFYNPLRQNAGHVAALKAFIPQVPASVFHPVVVFSDRCALKKVPADAADELTRLAGVPGVIARASSPVLSVQQVSWVVERLTPLTRASDDVRSAHVDRVAALQG